MRLKAAITLVFTFLLFGSIYSQEMSWNQGELFLKNGETKKGLIRFGHHIKKTISLFEQPDQTVRFKKASKGKKEKFKQLEIDHFIIHGDDYYTYVPVSRKRKSLFEVKAEGKVMLYHRYMNEGAGPSDAFSYNYIQEYHIKKEGEKVATLFISKRTMKSFRKMSRKYFSDCPSVMDLIENRTYRKRDVVLMVREYNKCVSAK